MALDVDQELTRLKGMTVTELRLRYREVFGEDTRSHHKQFLVRRIAWMLQARELGGLSERAHRRARELADETFLQTRAPKVLASSPAPERTAVRRFTSSHDRRLPMPGTLLTREYRGSKVVVKVLDGGFEDAGTVYRSLTAVAKAITGSHWNGYGFFGLLESKVGRR